MKITLVISSLSSGGAERVLVRLAQGFLDRGHQVSVVTIFGPELNFYSLPPKVTLSQLNLGIPSQTIFHGLIHNMKRIRTLRHTVLATSPEVVISFQTQTNIITLISLLKSNIPVIITEHIDPIVNKIPIVWQWLRYGTYQFTSKLVSPCIGLDRGFSWLEQGKRTVIYNPVLLESFESSAPPDFFDKKTIVAMGRLTYQKGFDLLIRAFAEIQKHFPDWQLIIIGEGELRQELEEQINRSHLSDIIKLPGVFKNPFPRIKAADIFVLSSRYEGFGLALAEAMACGLPVISFDCPSGPREIIRDGIDGVLVPNGDVDALAQAMARLMGDAEERQRLAKRAPEVLERFGLEKVMGMWEEVLEEVMEKPK